nr:unnamed protein product [Digitaria exilis]
MTGKIWGFELSLPPGELVVGIGDGDSGETAARLEEGGDWQCDKHGGVDDDVATLFPPVPRLVGLDPACEQRTRWPVFETNVRGGLRAAEEARGVAPGVGKTTSARVWCQSPARRVGGDEDSNAGLGGSTVAHTTQLSGVPTCRAVPVYRLARGPNDTQ